MAEIDAQAMGREPEHPSCNHLFSRSVYGICACLAVLTLVDPHPARAGTTPAPAVRRILLKKFMTVEAYDRAGLNRLTSAQRRALEVWLARHLKEIAGLSHPASRTQATAISHFGLPRHRRRALSGDTLESRIQGVFRGWNGSTRFHLVNGEVWVQADPASFSIPPMRDPRIIIKKLAFGYVLRVRGYGEEVFVTRVR